MFRALLSFISLCAVLAAEQGQTRIVGGDKASNIDIPWMVSVIRYGHHVCGGSVISARTVLTAAHCLLYVRVDTVSVRAGSKSQSSGGVLVGAESVATHEKFNMSNMDYDVGVIRLAEPLTFGTAIQPIQLPAYREEVPAGTTVVISGWGLYSTKVGVSPDYLRYAKVPVVSQFRCKALLKYDITDRMICAGYLLGGIDACQKDSGGPMFLDDKLVGIVSWGNGCALPGQPGVYTRVAELVPWIDKHI